MLFGLIKKKNMITICGGEGSLEDKTWMTWITQVCWGSQNPDHAMRKGSLLPQPREILFPKLILHNIVTARNMRIAEHYFSRRGQNASIIPSPVQLSEPNTSHQVKSIVNTTIRYFLGPNFWRVGITLSCNIIDTILTYNGRNGTTFGYSTLFPLNRAVLQ